MKKRTPFLLLFLLPFVFSACSDNLGPFCDATSVEPCENVATDPIGDPQRFDQDPRELDDLEEDDEEIVDGVFLTVINQSSQTDLNVVFFQTNTLGIPNMLVSAWVVISHLGIGQQYSFLLTSDFELEAVSDSGQRTTVLFADPGEGYIASDTGTGIELFFDGIFPTSNIRLTNNLSETLDANVLRGQRLLGVQTDIVPGQFAEFFYDDTLYVQVIPGIQEGDILSVESINSATALDVMGLFSANIVVSGNGSPFAFSLQNPIPLP